jgi:hypothetical protein
MGCCGGSNVKRTQPRSGLHVAPAQEWLLFNANQKPPGGWGVLPGQRAISPVQAADQYAASVGATQDDLPEVYEKVNRLYCARPGARCAEHPYRRRGAPNVKFLPSRTEAADGWTRSAWVLLHLCASVPPERFVPSRWRALLDTVTQLLSGDCPFTSFPEASATLSVFLSSHPVEEVSTPAQAAAYSHALHNFVNARLSPPRRQLSYGEAAGFWGWPELPS